MRVKIGSGEDIAHLGELDEKLWTVLSCPVDGLEMDKQTLKLIDTDGDGKIRVKEVVGTAQWLCSAIRDKDLILKGEDSLPLDALDLSTELGARLHNSAKQILSNLGADKSEISVADASDSATIFAGTKFNGDGVVTPISTEDPELKDLIAAVVAAEGGVADRSGEAGVNAESVEKFYTALADYAAWKDAGTAEVFPFGDKTAAGLDACEALKDKLADFYKRCALLRYDGATAAAVSVAVSSIDQIGDCPIAMPCGQGVLPLKGLNPAWQAKMDALLGIVGSEAYADGISEKAWGEICAKFSAYAAWIGAKKGAEVEALGLEKVKELLASGRKAELLELIEKDKEMEAQASGIDEVKKLMLLYRDFYKLLSNFVIFTDFYRRDGKRALFESGKLYLDQRCCDLCIKVTDMGKHADMAKLSGIFLVYCKCSSKLKSQSMDIVAVMTDGSVSELRPGKNGVFYDLNGCDWDAVITKVVDNPLSIKQAFWAPYKKFWEFCVGLINKSASDKDGKVTADLQKKAAELTAPKDPAAAGTAAAPKSAFDIAKFAGIFAAIGMALGYIGSFITSVAKGVSDAKWYEIVIALVAIVLVISGPSCFIAWSKLRKRNLGPVLNANGWAINSRVLINILFGAKLTSVARYPKLRLSDPYSNKTSAWSKWLILIAVVLLAAAAVLYFTGCFGECALNFQKK